MGTELCLACSGGDPRQASGVRICGRRVRSADRRADVDRPGDGARRFRLSMAQPQLMSRSTRPAPWSSATRCSSPRVTAPAARSSRCRPDFTHKVVWTTQEFGLHFNTAIHRGGYLYGFDGRNEPDASLACVDAATGRIVWRETPEWTETIEPARPRPAAAGRHVPGVAAGR